MRSVRSGDFSMGRVPAAFTDLMPEEKLNLTREDEIRVRFSGIVGIRWKTRKRRSDMGFLLLIAFAIYGLEYMIRYPGGEP